MKILAVSTWEEYQDQIKTLKRQVRAAWQADDYVATLLFRGQGNSRWNLDTTLDRYTRANVSLQEYFDKLAVIKHRVETFTERTWEFDREEATIWARTLPNGVIPGYELMVFLRHHGFPSPLLDWSESPQVAAFFAFREPPKDATHVSIYMYCETVDGAKMYESDTPSIHIFGPNIKSHPRHFLQQSNYTICTVFREMTQYFASHSDVQNGPVADLMQDMLWRIDIPVSERGKALAALGEYNLNSFSLFGSTESLLETLALQNFGGNHSEKGGL